MADDHEVWERYAPWEGTYRTSLWTAAPVGSARRPRLRRLVGRALAVVMVLLVVGFAVKVVVAVLRWDLLELLDVVLNPANGFLVLGVVLLLRPPETRLTPSGLVVRSEPWRTRVVGWGDVVELQAPGRFDLRPVALPGGGERLPLVGLPADVAVSMAAATHAERTNPPPPPPNRPSDPGDDLDGPFHRGWSPR